MPNAERLRQYAEWVEAQAQLPPAKRDWIQSAWQCPLEVRPPEYRNGHESCGTAYCVAGRVVADHGWQFVPPIYIDEIGGWDSDTIYDQHEADDPSNWDRVIHPTDPDRRRDVGEVAAELLDISPAQADALFSGSNSAQGIRVIVERIIAGEVVHALDLGDEEEGQG